MSEKSLNQRFHDSEKMRFVAQSWGLKEEAYGRFLRAHGLSSVELERWRQEMRDGLAEGKALPNSTKKQLENRIRLLEEENRLLRVENELQKKAQILEQEVAARRERERSEKKHSSSSRKASKKG
jgi:hypothetical protein